VVKKIPVLITTSEPEKHPIQSYQRLRSQMKGLQTVMTYYPLFHQLVEEIHHQQTIGALTQPDFPHLLRERVFNQLNWRNLTEDFALKVIQTFIEQGTVFHTFRIYDCSVLTAVLLETLLKVSWDSLRVLSLRKVGLEKSNLGPLLRPGIYLEKLEICHVDLRHMSPAFTDGFYRDIRLEALKHLRIEYCVLLETLEIQCPQLASLSLKNACSLPKEVILAFLEKVPGLKSLNLVGHLGYSSVGLADILSCHLPALTSLAVSVNAENEVETQKALTEVRGKWPLSHLQLAQQGILEKTLEEHSNSVQCVAALPSSEVVSGSWDKTLKVWDVKTGKCLKSLEGHGAWVYCVTVLPSGEVVSGSSDNTLKVWDVKTGVCLKTLEGHSNSVQCVAALPSGEVVSGSWDNTIKIWDVKTRVCLKTLVGHSNSVQCVAMLSSGKMVSGSYDGTLKVWDVKTGRCVETLEGHRDWVYCVVVLPSDELVSGSKDRTLKVWDVKTRMCLKTLRGHGGWVDCVTVLPSGEVVSGSRDDTLKVWDAKTGKCLKTLEGHANSVYCVTVLPGGEVVSGSRDDTLKVWSFRSLYLTFGQWCGITSLEIAGSSIRLGAPNAILQGLTELCEFLKMKVTYPTPHQLDIACESDENLLALLKILWGGKTISGKLYLDLGKTALKTLYLKDCKVLEGVTGDLARVKVLRLEGMQFTHQDGIGLLQKMPFLEVLHLKDHHPATTLDTILASPLSCLEHLSLDLVPGDQKTSNTALVQIGQRFPLLKSLRLNRQGILEKTLEWHGGSVWCVAMLLSGEVVSGSADCTLKVWDVKTGKCLETLKGHTGRVWCVAVLPSGEVVSGSYDRTLKVWDANTGKCLKTMEEHGGWVLCVSVFPSGEVVSGSINNTLKVWDVKTGRCLKTLEGHGGRVSCVAVLQSGEVVSGSWDNTLKIWNVKTGKCLETLKGHTGRVWCVAVLPSGEVVSGSSDNTLKVWDVKAGKCLKTLEGHGDSVYRVTVLSSSEVVSGSYDNTLKVWNVETGKCLKTLEGHGGGVYCVTVLPSGELVSGSQNGTLKIWSLGSMVLNFPGLNPHQPAAFQRLFFKPVNEDATARLKLFGFFSTRSWQSFGCANKACYELQETFNVNPKRS
jgi:WD40 repeat protein